MLPSNLSLDVEKTVGYNNKIWISNTDMKISENRNINTAKVCHHKSFQSRLPMAQLEAHTASEIHSMKTSDKPIKDVESIGNHNTFAEKHNHEKLATTTIIVGTMLTAYHF